MKRESSEKLAGTLMMQFVTVLLSIRPFPVLTKIIRSLDRHIRTVCYYTFLAIDFNPLNTELNPICQ